MMNSKLCVAYAADNNYSVFMGISMQSLFEANKDCDEITVFLLDYGIDESNREKLVTIAEKYGRTLNFVAVDDYIGRLNLNMGARKISIVSYARLFLPSIIPSEFDKVIYIDCDTIICDSLVPMWQTDFGSALVAGVQDTVDNYFLKIIGLPENARYINAGILLIKLAAWREENLQDQFLKYIDEMGGNVPHHDQGTINHVCGDRRIILPLRFNVTSNIFSFNVKVIKRMHDIKGEYYAQSDVDEARKNPAILHFTTGLLGRPWEENCRHPLRSKFEDALSKSPWSGRKLDPDKMKFSVKVSAFVCEHISPRLFGEIYRLTNWWLHR